MKTTPQTPVTRPKLDYDQLALEYDTRYSADGLTSTGQALLRLVRAMPASRALEVGCGTGYWLAALYGVVRQLFGLDLSAGMLRQAQKREAPIRLLQSPAERLPFKSDAFDLVFCVNAIHHFAHPQAFVGEAHRVLVGGGTLAVVGTDPHGQKESWYGFRYFEGTFETDLQRFPAWDTVGAWMSEAGFEGIELRGVERIVETWQGRKVLADPFLRRNACSRLALLSDEAYRAGLQRIETALAQAEARGETIVFRTDIPMSMLTGRKVERTAIRGEDS